VQRIFGQALTALSGDALSTANGSSFML
jgi:hypothetical protein